MGGRCRRELADTGREGSVGRLSNPKEDLKRIQRDEPGIILENRVPARLSGCCALMVVRRLYQCSLGRVSGAPARLDPSSKQLILLKNKLEIT